MYITYRQLFGYGWWGTLWRLAVIIILVLMTMMVVVLTIGYAYDNDIYDALISILIILVPTVLLAAVILFVTHRINKRTYRNNKEILSKLENRFNQVRI